MPRKNYKTPRWYESQAMPVPGRLRLARLNAGLTQQQLADALGFSKNMISKYERGESNPAWETVVAIAQLTGELPEHFMSDTYTFLTLDRYQSCSNYGGSAVHGVERNIQHWFNRYAEIETILGQTLRFRQPPRTRYTELHTKDALAEDVRAAWGLGELPALDVAEMLEAHGIKVCRTTVVRHHRLNYAGEVAAGGINAVFALHPDTPWSEANFILAHLLGHLIIGVPWFHRDRAAEIHRQWEADCNTFAEAFLAPRAAVLREVGERRHLLPASELLYLRQRWGLSPARWISYLRRLEVIDEHAERRMRETVLPELADRVDGRPYVSFPERMARLILRAEAEELITPETSERLWGRPASPAQ